MTEQDYLWFLARLYCVQRLEYVTSRLAPLHDELATILSKAAGFAISSTEATDSDILEHFRVRESIPAKATPPEPSRSSKSKQAKED